jgi:serine/threonine protein kinase
VPPAAASAGSASAGAAGAKADPLAAPELRDFLAPPQDVDEIGRLGSYRILKVLGAGGMGVVYQAEDMMLKRRVALKAMLPALATSSSSRQRFLREAQAAAAIEHEHIVTIYQVGEDRGVPYLAMPLLQGEPLDRRLEREPILPLADTLRIGREIAEGLAAAHERGLIHRDVKPGNVWLESPQGRVKILDFGLARSIGDPSKLTQQGAIIGTPAYMAPEQARGEGVGPPCDLFSLGCVLYRLCTGELPFHGTDTLSALVAVVMDTPVPPRERNSLVPQGLSDLVTRLLAKKPEDRPASAHTVAQMLQAIAQDPAARQLAHAFPQPAATQTGTALPVFALAYGNPQGTRTAVFITVIVMVLSLAAAAALALLMGPTDTPEKSDGSIRNAPQPGRELSWKKHRTEWERSLESSVPTA